MENILKEEKSQKNTANGHKQEYNSMFDIEDDAYEEPSSRYLRIKRAKQRKYTHIASKRPEIDSLSIEKALKSPDAFSGTKGQIKS